MNVLGLPVGYFFGKWELKELECWLISTIVGIVASLVTFCKNLRSAVLWKFAVCKPDHRQPLKRCVLCLFMRLPCGGLLFIPHYTGSYVNRGNIPSIINSSHSFLFCNSGIWSNQYKFMNESQRLRVEAGFLRIVVDAETAYSCERIFSHFAGKRTQSMRATFA